MGWIPRLYTPHDIEILYSGAKDKVSEIKILSELNCCSEEEIADYLNHRGLLVGKDYIVIKKYFKAKEERRGRNNLQGQS